MTRYQNEDILEFQNEDILEFIGAEDDGSSDDNLSYNTCKIIVTNKPTSSFLQTDALSVAQPIASKH